MKKNKPMDRLLYGDVGFGKTEVALRAAMIAINSGKVVFSYHQQQCCQINIS